MNPNKHLSLLNIPVKIWLFKWSTLQVLKVLYGTLILLLKVQELRNSQLSLMLRLLAAEAANLISIKTKSSSDTLKSSSPKMKSKSVFLPIPWFKVNWKNGLSNSTISTWTELNNSKILMSLPSNLPETMLISTTSPWDKINQKVVI